MNILPKSDGPILWSTKSYSLTLYLAAMTILNPLDLIKPQFQFVSLLLSERVTVIGFHPN